MSKFETIVIKTAQLATGKTSTKKRCTDSLLAFFAREAGERIDNGQARIVSVDQFFKEYREDKDYQKNRKDIYDPLGISDDEIRLIMTQGISNPIYPNKEYKPVSNPMREVGRNDPCPCGSGKKYKKCCGR